MLSLLTAFPFLLCCAQAVSEPGLAAELREQLQPLVNSAANVSASAVAIGVVVGRNVSMELVAGSVDALDGQSGAPAKEGDQYLWGSVTKTMVGAGIMQLVAEGKISLDDKAHIYVDQMLKREKYAYQSMEELFKTDRWGMPQSNQSFNASHITVRHLMAMKSGVPDFDTDAYRAFQYHHNLVDMSPLDIFGWVHGALMFNPGDVPSSGGRDGGMSYCSVNFLLLGYILAYHAGADTWSSFDQRSSLPAVVQKRMSGLVFPTRGPCQEWTRVHGFDVPYKYDVFNTSCLGSWTAGNVVMPPLASAEWARALYGPDHEVVSNDILQQMLPKGQEFYGLATMNMSTFVGDQGKYGLAVGHLGDTYGFDSIMAYFPELDVGFSVALNHEGHTQGGPAAVICSAYNRVVDVILQQKHRNCSYVQHSYYFGRCECKDLGEKPRVGKAMGFII